MKRNTLFFLASVFSSMFFSTTGSAQSEMILPLSAYANLRHDVFGNDYINIYGTADLYANLNSINDDRAVIEFPTYQLPAGSVVNSATLTIYVWQGGGTIGDSGDFRLYGYNGDGVAGMTDYYAQEVSLRTFSEGVPPSFGYTRFDVSSFIQSQRAGGVDYSGFLFQALSQNVLMGFGCPGPNTYPWPTLDVKYTVVPEPEVPLLVLAAIFCWQRRPRAAITRS